MIFSLDVRRARKGDCLLLHFGSKDEPGLVMIDGGPAGVYNPHLRPRLEQIKAARGLREKDSLPVDLLMVSHVDDDHIRGILDLTREMIEAREASESLLVRVHSLWHNSFDTVIGNKPNELTAAIGSRFGAASESGELPSEATIDEDENWPEARPPEEVIVDNLKVLASIRQGHRLRDDASKLGIEINPEFEGELIIARKDSEGIEFPPGLEIIPVGPMMAEVDALQKKHDAWLKKLEKEGLSPSAALAAYVDKSVANLSSLVLLVEGEGKRMLLTGDARGDKILEGLELLGLLRDDDDGKLHVDLLKVPHHGSANNLEDDFFQRVTADHYVFSGDGKHGNPERESLEMLFRSRGDEPFTIHLTYPIEEIDIEREKDWEKAQQKEKKRRDKKVTEEEKNQVTVRPDWSPALHSLARLLEQQPLKAGQALKVVDSGKAHVVDLGEPLGDAWHALIE